MVDEQCQRRTEHRCNSTKSNGAGAKREQRIFELAKARLAFIHGFLDLQAEPRRWAIGFGDHASNLHFDAVNAFVNQLKFSAVLGSPTLDLPQSFFDPR